MLLFRKKKLITKLELFFAFLNTFLLFFLTLFVYMNFNNFDFIQRWSVIATQLTITMFFYHVLWMIKLKIKYTDFEFWFVLLSYLFLFGRVILNGLSLDKNIFWDLIIRYNRETLYHTSLYLILALHATFFGLFILRKKSSVNIRRNQNTYNIGKILFLSTFVFKVIDDFYNILQAQSAGSYSALKGRVGFIDDLAFLTVPGIIYIIGSKKLTSKSAKYIVYLTSFYLVGFMILSGDRRYSATALLSVFLVYFKVYNIKFNRRTTLIYLFLGSTMLNIFTIIRDIRTDSLTNIYTFITENIKNIFQYKDIIIETFSEFGLTFFSVANIFRFVPNELPFQKGLPFIYTLPSVLPVGWLFGNLFSKASILEQTNQLINLPVGSSMLGDLYGNFSWFGIPVAFIFGLLIFKVFNSKKNFDSPARYYSMFYILINLVRANFFEIYRPLMYILFFPYLIDKLLNRGGF